MRDIQLLFFAQVGEKLGCRQHRIKIAESTITINELVEQLIRSDSKWSLLTDPVIKVAVNHNIVDRSHVLTDAVEIAFFPPVTGG